ncbi:MAG TPA: DegT/DnrJ/EryC1/StrS family aminotransferase [Stellaceae bacterium]|nr:DegT/DnrJ/EryC1/StrS family aminotransferase [Stellaceae bacterium]
MSAPQVPFADLGWQWRQIEAEALPDLGRLFAASAFCLGPWVERFETEIAAYLGVGQAIGVNSGTSALHLALIAAGIGPGDRVLVPANTFVATAWAVLYVGAAPVLCDVEPGSWNIDPTDAERRCGPAVRAILPVHLYGQPADMAAINALAGRHGLAVIEDAAQAIGAAYGGRRVGGFGRLGCFSFYPAKNLGAAGEAGLVTTDDAALAKRVRALRDHAQIERYVHSELGFNYRMDGIQGLVLSHKLLRLEEWTAQRRAVAQRYLDELSDTPLELPRVVNGDHVWHLFVVHTPKRDRLRRHLHERGIHTGLHYPVPLHRQSCFSHLEIDQSSFPCADRNARECLSLPIFAGMTPAQTDRVIAEIHGFFGL